MPDIGREYVTYCRRRLLEEYLPRIERCIHELSEDDVWWRSHDTGNSVGNLLLHLSGNVRQWIIAGLGDTETQARNRPREFAERTRIPKEMIYNELASVVRDACSVLERFDTAKFLDQTRIQGHDTTYLDALSHVLEHFAQHLGQIIYITKLRTGKYLKFYDL